MKYDRALLEKAVKTYKKVSNRNFVPASKLSEKQISNAIKHIDKYVKPEDVVAFLDNTLFSSGKGGILLTTEKITCSDSISSSAYFEKFIKAECSGDEVKVYYSENSFRRIKIKTYAGEVASLLNAIAKERLLAEKAELEKQEILIKAEAKTAAETEKKTVEIKEKTVPVKNEISSRFSYKEAEKKEAEEIFVPDANEDELYFEGLKFHERKMMQNAFAYLKKSAEKGFEPAYYHLGKMYYFGEGTKTDCEKAYFWLKKSAEEEFEPALCLCAEMILCGYLGTGKEEEAVDYLDIAASGGSARAKELEGHFYEVCHKIHKEKKAREEAKAAAETRATVEAREKIKESRKGYPLNFDKALSGDTRAMLELADACQEEGEDIYSEEKLREAFFWAVFAAEEGSHPAIKKVGEMLENGIGVPANNEKALEWYDKTPFAAGSYELLKTNIDTGIVDLVPDPESFDEFVENCSIEGEGIFELAFSFEEKFDGFRELFIAAALDDPDAQCFIGKMYCKGCDFIKMDASKAESWLKRAVKNGSEEAYELLRKTV